MPGPGRNDRCQCGSGKKVKRCCGQQKGPDEDQRARAFLSVERRAAVASLIDDHDEEELVELVRRIVKLPASYDELLVDLPRLSHPDLERLRREIERGDLHRDSPALSRALAVVDRPAVRARLARNALRLRDEGDLDKCVAAAAVADLGTPESFLLQASLIQALGVDTGLATRASGLLVAR